MQTHQINEDITITITDGVLGIWNLLTGEQYEIYERRYLDRIFELTENHALPYTASPEDDVLVQAGILMTGAVALEYQKKALQNGKWGWDFISKIFHFGSKHNFPSSSSEAGEDTESGYLSFCEEIENTMPALNIERHGEIIRLPEPDIQRLKDVSIQDVLWRRMTSRSFNNEPTDLAVISNILYTTFGKIHGDSHIEDMARRGVKTVGYRRSSPSAGCLQATEAYLIALNVNGLDKGAYHYRSHQHSLTTVRSELPKLDQLLCHQSFANEASFLIVMTSRFDKLWWKYPHSRAYRSGLLDVGHLSQTFNLVTTAYNLNTWVTGYFIDDHLNELINVDGFKEHSIFVMAGGPGNSDPLSSAVKELL